MKTLSHKEVVLGVTGSIAAYKACEIASLLVKRGVRVTPVLTHSARELVGPAGFEAITGQRAITEMFEPLPNPDVEHIAVATRADLFLIAPATANILAKAAHGLADDWLSTTLLATRAPIVFAPAMNTHMYEHAATQENIRILRERGCRFIGPDSGRLACGTVGVGRMAEPECIVEAVLPLLDPRSDFEGVRVLITSGATREPLDPVRFLSNRSSGKMGRALASEALARGAQVTVVSGPAETPLPYGAEVIRVETACEMAAAVAQRISEADVFIAAAAVADFRAEDIAASKLKRQGGNASLTLVENPDILAAVGAQKRSRQIIVGFAAETEDLVRNAREKLDKKHIDLLAANLVGVESSGFGADTVQACLLDASGNAEDLGLLTKADLAERLFDRIAELRANEETQRIREADHA